QENQMVNVSPERRHNFFISVNGYYQICKTARELCVFARQDLVSDPPFSNIDLISCRNVLIYLGEPLQKRVMSIFYYSLNSMGFLLLGNSESPGQLSDLFNLADKRSRIYTKKLNATQPIISFSASNYLRSNVDENKQLNESPADDSDLQQEIDQAILNYYNPAGVVINEKMDIIQLRGETSFYLRLAPGAPSFNLFKMVREDLLIELRAAVYQAQREEKPVVREGLKVEAEYQSKTINLRVVPFRPARIEDYYFLIIFEEAIVPVEPSSSINLVSLDQGDLEREVVRLREELAIANQRQATQQAYLQALTQEQDSTNQELKVANEEILSSNEELQSTNEELETAKEEIQATNEELNTTNEELRTRNRELDHINNDLINLLASINIPILMLTNDLRIRRFTPMAEQLFNFIPTDVGRPLSHIRANLRLPNLEPLVLEVLDTLNTKELEVQTPDGYWYNLRIRPYRTVENQIDGVVLVLIDINHLKRSATLLEISRNYAEAIVETVPVPLLVLDSDLRVNRVNRAFYEVFQVSPQETVGCPILALRNGEWNLPELRSPLEALLTQNTLLQNLEIEHTFEQIGQKTLLLNACKILREGDVPMLLLLLEDITERKQLERKRLQLLEEQLARQQAESANQAKDAFLANLSHELRNPLQTMLGWTQMLRKRQLDDTATARALESVERSAKVQSQLIEDLLDVSRITSGQLHLKARLTDLLPVVGAAIDAIQLTAEAKNIQIVSRLNPVTVNGDADRLQQVLWNLLSNAIKFTPAGGQVEVTLAPVQDQAEIRVSDTGQGMAADLLPYIFDRFRQGDSSSSKPIQGLGLGLSIVRHIVEMHGGTVQAESPGVGQGTTMIVRLPLQAMPPESPWPIDGETSSEEALDGARQEGLSLAGLQILAVEDEIDNRELLQWMLEGYGAEVVAVASAREALSALTADPGKYDVLVSDIGMPQEDGYWLIQQVRALDAESGGQIPAIALTGYAGEQSRQEAIAAGFQAHLAKPVDPDDLEWMVANLMGRGGDRGF
ncbi:MAG: PAS domain-containing protein, partial [Leptolyngbyaceae bacterium]|nr:PAS domain-containing protein [Leptolyngbyaceae bacterium]